MITLLHLLPTTTSPSPALLNSSREMRNMAEKMRRDKLNSSINTLADIVPLGSGATKRIDKTSVLRLAANYIRICNILREDEDDSVGGGGELLGEGVAHALAEAVGGFLMVVTSTGKVIYVTEAVDQFFGHSQVDLLNRSIYNVIHPDDHEIFRQQLDPKGTSRRSFFCRMMEKALTRNDPGRYEIIHVVGKLRPIPSNIPSGATGTVHTLSPISNDHDSEEANSEEEDDVQSSRGAAARQKVGTHMLVSFVRVVKDRPITELSLVESTQDEYITRHGMDGNILYTDHRISFVTGLMPSEVVGTSAFTYMHLDDMVWSIMAQRLMFTSTQGQGTVSYRLKCKNGELVNLRSRGYLEVNKQTGQIESFVCINTVLNNVKEADTEIKNQRRNLLPIVASEDCDDYLINISSSLPPELLKIVKDMMKPGALKRLFASFEGGTEGTGRQKQVTNMILGSQSDASSHTSMVQDTTLTHSENLDDLDAFQSRPKKMCNYESSSSSVVPDVTQRKSNKDLDDNSWFPVRSPRSASAVEFKGVVTSKFSFNPNNPRPSTSHHYTSPTGSGPMPDQGGGEFSPPSSSKHPVSVMKCTTLNTAENNTPGSYQNNIYNTVSPQVLCDTGITSPMSNESSFIGDKSPLPSSPYMQSVLSVDTLAPETPNHRKLLSPNYQFSPNPNQNVRGKLCHAEVRNHDRDNNFLMDTNYTNVTVNSGEAAPSGNSPKISPSPGILDSSDASMVSNSYPSGSQWNETRETYNITSNHQYINKNSIPHNQNYQPISSSQSKDTWFKNNSPLFPLEQFSSQVTRSERQESQYHQNNRTSQQILTESNIQSNLEQEFDMNSTQGFDINLSYCSPMQQTLNPQEQQYEAELTNSYSSSRQCLPLERKAESRESPHMYLTVPATSDSSVAVQCSANFKFSTTNQCPGGREYWGTHHAQGTDETHHSGLGLQEECERLMAKDGGRMEGDVPLEGVYNTQCIPQHHQQHTQPKGKLL
ncbi:hypothetical protein Pmani_020608 [Petrolisthes manimaculis]|uniref:Methoprene-tolerant protein n=1 Tax=Petrolisthes manimaculis TaxID=1843537 RepID=A0AAE1U2E9_9EUCA|nr:hypothetical protein Pmani_020608 [Petrolisthes manimaculis]